MDRSWQDVDWSTHQHWVEVADRPVNVIELGEGPPVVFVHGHGGAWQNWLEQLPALAPAHRVIAFDLPGFGASPLPRDPITVQGYARIVDELMGRLGVDPAAVVGNSLGGFIAAELALVAPERVERLVLVSAAGVARSYIRMPLRVLDHVAEPALTALGPLLVPVESRIRRLTRRPGLRRALFALLSPHPERLELPLFYETAMASGPKPGAPLAAAEIARYDFRDRLPEIACPTLVVWGARDWIVPPSGADEFARLIPDARKVVFEDCGHVPMLEQPARFNRLLEEFLAEVPAAPEAAAATRS